MLEKILQDARDCGSENTEINDALDMYTALDFIRLAYEAGKRDGGLCQECRKDVGYCASCPGLGE
jgi:hypothetical protein